MLISVNSVRTVIERGFAETLLYMRSFNSSESSKTSKLNQITHRQSLIRYSRYSAQRPMANNFQKAKIDSFQTLAIRMTEGKQSSMNNQHNLRRSGKRRMINLTKAQQKAALRKRDPLPETLNRSKRSKILYKNMTKKKSKRGGGDRRR
ncbi:unnamed protein product [Brassica oleracea]